MVAAEVTRLGSHPVPSAGTAARGGCIIEKPEQVEAQVVRGPEGDEPGVTEQVLYHGANIHTFTFEKKLNLLGKFLVLCLTDDL